MINQGLRRAVEERVGFSIPHEAWEYLERRYDAWDEDVAVEDLAQDVVELRDAGLLGLPRRRVSAPRRSEPPDRRHVALSRILAAEAARREDVREFRQDVLNGRLLAQDEVETFLQARLEAEGPPTLWARFPLPAGLQVDPLLAPARDVLAEVAPKLSPNARLTAFEPRFLDYAKSDDRWVYCVPVPVGGVLERLKRLAGHLAEDYGWPEAAATTFVLTGAMPIVSPALIDVRVGSDTPALNRITLRLDPRLSPKEVAAIYARARRRLLGPGHKDRVITEKHLELAAHFAERGAEDGGWDELMASWNATYPRWAYATVNHFSRDVRQAWARVTGRGWPGFRQALRGRNASWVEALREGLLLMSERQEAADGEART